MPTAPTQPLLNLLLNLNKIWRKREADKLAELRVRQEAEVWTRGLLGSVGTRDPSAHPARLPPSPIPSPLPDMRPSTALNPFHAPSCVKIHELYHQRAPYEPPPPNPTARPPRA
eukprot:361293-Chlamydomonas_euryale.AAC.5